MGNKGKSFKQKSQIAKNRNETALNILRTTEENLVVGRVDKELGNCQFKVYLNNGRDVIATLPGVFKKACFIRADSVVVVEDGLPGTICGIRFVLCERDVKQLIVDGLINPNIADRNYTDEKDDVFDFDSDSEDMNIDDI